jgi:hypothetical protein
MYLRSLILWDIARLLWVMCYSRFGTSYRPIFESRVANTITCHEGTEGEQRYTSTLSLTSALDGVGGKRHAPVARMAQCPCIAGWMGIGKWRYFFTNCSGFESVTYSGIM